MKFTDLSPIILLYLVLSMRMEHGDMIYVAENFLNRFLKTKRIFYNNFFEL